MAEPAHQGNLLDQTIAFSRIYCCLQTSSCQQKIQEEDFAWKKLHIADYKIYLFYGYSKHKYKVLMAVNP